MIWVAFLLTSVAGGLLAGRRVAGRVVAGSVSAVGVDELFPKHAMRSKSSASQQVGVASSVLRRDIVSYLGMPYRAMACR